MKPAKVWAGALGLCEEICPKMGGGWRNLHLPQGTAPGLAGGCPGPGSEFQHLTCRLQVKLASGSLFIVCLLVTVLWL